MPNPAKQDGQGAQTAVAPAPPTADKPRTATQERSADLPDELQGLAAHLDIPDDALRQLQPKTVQPMGEGDIPPSHGADAPQATDLPTDTRDDQDEPPQAAFPTPAAVEDETDDDPETEPSQEQQPRIDKRVKRIRKLTAQKTELETAVRQRDEAIAELTARLGNGQKPPQDERPATFDNLAYIKDENHLDKELAFASKIIEFCDRNADGFQSGDKFVSPEDVAADRRKAEMTVMWGPNRRIQLRDEQVNQAQFMNVKQNFDNMTREVMPAIFKEGTQENQEFNELKRMYPVLDALPMGTYAAALMIEGGRAIDARRSGNGAPQRQHRDINEAAFRPRVPIAPHTANPPTREATPSSAKQVNEAMSNLVKDQDGSAESLASVFAAMQKAESKTPKPNSLVRS